MLLSTDFRAPNWRNALHMKWAIWANGLVIAIFNARFNHLGIAFIPPSSPTFASSPSSSSSSSFSFRQLIDTNVWRFDRFSLLGDCKMCVCGSNVTHQKPLIYFNSTICRCVSLAILPDSTLLFFLLQYSLSRCRKYMFILVVFRFHHHHLLHPPFLRISVLSFLILPCLHRLRVTL